MLACYKRLPSNHHSTCSSASSYISLCLLAFKSLVKGCFKFVCNISYTFLAVTTVIPFLAYYFNFQRLHISTFTSSFYHGLRRGLLLVVKLMLLFFSSSTLSKIAHYLALAVSIFIKLSLLDSLGQALSTVSQQ